MDEKSLLNTPVAEKPFTLNTRAIEVEKKLPERTIEAFKSKTSFVTATSITKHNLPVTTTDIGPPTAKYSEIEKPIEKPIEKASEVPNKSKKTPAIPENQPNEKKTDPVPQSVTTHILVETATIAESKSSLVSDNYGAAAGYNKNEYDGLGLIGVYQSSMGFTNLGSDTNNPSHMFIFWAVLSIGCYIWMKRY
ncbi:hypothetical protein G6F56_007170 [Rhizopus delemar]|nr:hypothetical protein G6F56_007170 [Rhizopus delemar]